MKTSAVLLKITAFIILSAFLLSAAACKDKEEESMDWITNLLVGGGFTDLGNGTIKDNNTNLIWMKCAYGQLWNSGFNDCAGTGGGTTSGAKSVAFCEAVVDYTKFECTNEDYYNPLAITGPAVNACAIVATGGVTGWRLPTKEELLALSSVVAGKTMLDYVFPQTPDDKHFWTASAEPESDTGDNAFGVSFAQSTFGATGLFHKANSNLYVRCVRP